MLRKLFLGSMFCTNGDNLSYIRMIHGDYSQYKSRVVRKDVHIRYILYEGQYGNIITHGPCPDHRFCICITLSDYAFCSLPTLFLILMKEIFLKKRTIDMGGLSFFLPKFII